jgi:hypothetical protein
VPVVTTITSTPSATDAASVTSGAVVPLMNDQLVLIVGWTGINNLTAAQIRITHSVANLPGWVPLGEGFATAGFGMAAFICADFQKVLTSRTVTATYGGSTATGTFIAVVAVRNTNFRGPGCIRQWSMATFAAAGTPTVTFPVAVVADSSVMGSVMNQTNPAGLTAPTNFGEGWDTGIATPVAGWEGVARNRGQTGTSLTWGGTSASAGVVMGFEFLGDSPDADDVPKVEAGWGAM